MRSRSYLRLAIGILAAVALVWFIASFFVLKDENPRGSLAGPSHARAVPVAPPGIKGVPSA